ncbi:MAG: hypothetical protein ABFS41_07970, partial [Myxococcota bacterium]
RGRRRPEVVLAIGLLFLFYLLQTYGMSASSLPKRLVVALRYFDPLLPVLAVAMAESVPRLLGGRLSARAAAERWVGRLGALWVGGVLLAALGVHPGLDRWGASQNEIRAAIARTVPIDAVLITNGAALRKFIDQLERPYVILHRDRVSPKELRAIRRRHGTYMIALLDRSDSAYWREDAARSADFIARLGDPVPLIDLRPTETDRLRIWRIGYRAR